MPTSETLKRKINSVQELQAIVKTMKALAAVSIRQYERAVSSLVDYQQTLELGLQVLLQQSSVHFPAQSRSSMPPSLVVFGSDQGMCGHFNEQLVRFLRDRFPPHPRSMSLDISNQINKNLSPYRLIAIGSRIDAHLADEGYLSNLHYMVPSSVNGIIPIVQTVVQQLDLWRSQGVIGSIHVFHNRFLGGSAYRPKTFQLYPLDPDWLNRLKTEPWRSRPLPMVNLPHESLFSALFQHLFFLGLFRACAESLASENASRLASMQWAEKNIQDRLSQLQSNYHQHRQTLVTEELLDIIAGFEALKDGATSPLYPNE